MCSCTDKQDQKAETPTGINPAHGARLDADAVLKAARDSLDNASTSLASTLDVVARYDATRPGYEPALVVVVADARNRLDTVQRQIEHAIQALDPNTPKGAVKAYNINDQLAEYAAKEREARRIIG